MGNVTIQALQFALNGLSIRQKAIANNIANEQTPGFLATNVHFANSLQQALSSNSSASISTSISNQPIRSDGNNVNLTQQEVNLQNTSLKYQAMISGLNSKFADLKASMDVNF